MVNSHHSNLQRQSLNKADLEGATYLFPEDHEAASPGGVFPAWPTPSGMSELQARALCQQAVVNSGLASSCRHLLTESFLAQAESMCISDLRLKDELSWLNATLPLLENECERRLVEKGWSQQENLEAATLLRCPNMCSWNGQCSEWGCFCFPGFGSHDCSTISGRKPKTEEKRFSVPFNLTELNVNVHVSVVVSCHLEFIPFKDKLVLVFLKKICLCQIFRCL